MADDKYEKLIEKQMEREEAMKQVKKDYVDEIETPRKQLLRYFRTLTEN